MIGEVSTLLCLEATRDLPLRPAQVETPIGKADVQMLAGRKLAIVPILRAGLGMVDGILQLVPAAKTGHIGLERDHDTLKPWEYYCKLPSDISQRDVLLLDPMLATGGSASAAIQLLKEKGVRRLSFVCVVAAPEGVERITREHPEIPIYCAALDQGSMRMVTSSPVWEMRETGSSAPNKGHKKGRRPNVSSRKWESHVTVCRVPKNSGGGHAFCGGRGAVWWTQRPEAEAAGSAPPG